MKLLFGMMLILPMYLLLQLTSLIARSMAVVSAVVANATIALVFWTKSSWLIDRAMKHFGFEK